MTSLARLTNSNGKVFYLNPDHVVMIVEVAQGTNISLSQGATHGPNPSVTVKEAINVVVAAIQGAVSR